MPARRGGRSAESEHQPIRVVGQPSVRVRGPPSLPLHAILAPMVAHVRPPLQLVERTRPDATRRDAVISAPRHRDDNATTPACRLAIDGTAKIGEMLFMNHWLRTLDLGQNALGDDGASRVADAVRVNQGLRTLVLAGNHIHDKARRRCRQRAAVAALARRAVPRYDCPPNATPRRRPPAERAPSPPPVGSPRQLTAVTRRTALCWGGSRCVPGRRSARARGRRPHCRCARAQPFADVPLARAQPDLAARRGGARAAARRAPQGGGRRVL